MSICSADGVGGNPGILSIFPVIGIIKPAPEAISTSRTVNAKSLGRPIDLASSDNEL